jgi:YidC/Oxa1 family membrane protein insertase
MEKRTILAFVLMFLVLLGFQYIRQKIYPVSNKTAVENGQKNTAYVPPQPAVSIPNPATIQPKNEAPAGKNNVTDTNAAAKTVVIEGDLYRAILNNRGAVLTNWELKGYRSVKNQVFEMIPPSNGGQIRTYPGMVFFSDTAVTALANEEFYEVEINGKKDEEKSLVPPVTVSMKLKRGDLVIEKKYHFEKENYLTEISANFEKGGKALEGQFLLGQDIGPEQEHLINSSATLEAVFYKDGKVKRESPPKNPSEIKKIDGAIHWVGLDMQYFTAIVIPSQPLSFYSIQKRQTKTLSLDGKEIERDLLRLTTPINGKFQCRIYLGPKKQSNLQAVKAVNLQGVINYGMFSFIVIPLLIALKWLYQFVHNYGWAIILLTFLLSLLLFPFRIKQMLSMKKMQAVQPKIKAIQEKYRRYKKTDPKRAEMNQEIMALYREHNVNPIGGCLPLLLQMPLLIAFYSLLSYSIELRQAPFIWWMHDLSAKDPYYVLPIVMGITMFISQKMMPMTPGTDPLQAKMMMLMPVMLTVFFLNVSSGLNLYFLCSNIFQVLFQKITQSWIDDGHSSGSTKL